MTMLTVLAAIGSISLALVLWYAVLLHRHYRGLRIAAREEGRAVVIDYSEARARALAQLGDRYLLANPVNRPAAKTTET